MWPWTKQQIQVAGWYILGSRSVCLPTYSQMSASWQIGCIGYGLNLGWYWLRCINRWGMKLRSCRATSWSCSRDISWVYPWERPPGIWQIMLSKKKILWWNYHRWLLRCEWKYMWSFYHFYSQKLCACTDMSDFLQGIIYLLINLLLKAIKWNTWEFSNFLKNHSDLVCHYNIQLPLFLKTYLPLHFGRVWAAR